MMIRSALWMGILLVAAACSRTETIIVRSPVIVATPSSEPLGEDFQPIVASSLLRIAELLPFETFDPLLARNNSDFRKIQLAYEGLFRLNSQGEPVPNLAQSVEISADSLVYTFRLRQNAFYHNDPSFSSGLGRQVTSNDVIQTFARMTSREVPENAADLFAPIILGFDLHNREQRDLYLTKLRQTTSIPGIERVDSRTVRFVLNQPNPNFLHLLASPYAMIYPMESVSVMGSRPVGTGAYRLQAQHGDSLTTFVLNLGHPDTASFKIRRVDFIHKTNEPRTYRALVLKDVDMIAEVGPIIAQGIPDIQPNQFSIISFPNRDQVSVSLNPTNANGVSMEDAAALIRAVFSDSLNANLRRSGYERIAFADVDADQIPNRPISYKLTPHMHEDLVSRLLYVQLRRMADVGLLSGEAISREVTLYTSHSTRFSAERMSPDYRDVVRFDIHGYRMVHPYVSGFDASPYSWWLDLRGVEIRR